jgi:hypothetical protein
MPLEPADSDPTAINVRFSKQHVVIIWPGLHYIICQNQTREQSGRSVTSYAFDVDPLPPGCDSGTFSARMMDRIVQLFAKLQPINATGGGVWLGEFELRAAIFAARTSLQLERHHIRKAKKKGAEAQRRLARARRDLKKRDVQKKRVVEFLEKALKRASRQFKSVLGTEEFKSQSKEWQSHIRWIEFHLTYFKPVPRLRSIRTKIRSIWLDQLVEMAEAAMLDQGYELPGRGELTPVLRTFLDYSIRGRMGEYDHMFMVENRDRSVAQLKLLDFVQERLVLQEAR